MELYQADHPMVRHKLTMLRDKNTPTKAFRELLDEIATMLVYEATRDLPLEDVVVETPLTETTGKRISGKKLALVPVLRAGLGMVDGAMRIVPSARVGHIGLQRNEDTLQPLSYYTRLPDDINKRLVLVLDPMLATGGSAAKAVSLLKERGCKNLRLISIIGAPEGVDHMRQEHPDVNVYLGALDERLNEHGFIVPGLGDAGDRLFGTMPGNSEE